MVDLSNAFFPVRHDLVFSSSADQEQNTDAGLFSPHMSEDDENEDQDLVINFSNLRLDKIPESVFGEIQVRMFDCSRNNLEEIPSQITRLVNLEGFNASLNELKKLPDLKSLLELDMLILS